MKVSWLVYFVSSPFYFSPSKRGEIDVSRLMFIEALWQHPSTAVSCKEMFPGLYTNRRTRMDTKLIDCQSEGAWE
ncbi:hypothetical protein CsSME_00010534 [Camellia sinensis var. sinensis]